MSSIEGGGKKIGFSLASSKKGRKGVAKKAAAEFGDPEEEQNSSDDEVINNDIPKKPLVIPCQKDSRQSLQEQARARRQKENQPDTVGSNTHDPEGQANQDPAVKQEEPTNDSTTEPPQTDEDKAAIEDLNKEAAAAQGNGYSDNKGTNNKRVIASTGDTFQRQSKNDDQKKFEADVEELPPDISVQSKVYKTVPISEFGAAMLRGMGWQGGNEDHRNKTKDTTTAMPRPSRLGLGATPKIADDIPDTHSRRRPKRHDQLQREERLKRQREEMEQEKKRQMALDKQRVLQLGSIVFVDDEDDDRGRASRRTRRKRAVIKKLAGVPGLNMILVQYEGDAAPSKVKKGSIELVERTDLNERPFRYEEDRKRSREDASRNKWDNNSSRSNDERVDNDRRRDRRRERERRERDHDNYDYDRDRDRDRRRDRDKDRYRDRDRDRDHDRDRDRDRDRNKRRRDDERRRDDDKKRSRRSVDPNPSSRNNSSSAVSSSWLIPNIRVRVISSRYGDSYYKEKGVVVDVTRKGVATLNMGGGQVISVAERHLETALPKVGGSSIVLSGNRRFSKGRLLERDSKKNRGVIQVFEDMSVITTSLDDMAEWCGPLDDDLEH